MAEPMNLLESVVRRSAEIAVLRDDLARNRGDRARLRKRIQRAIEALDEGRADDARLMLRVALNCRLRALSKK